MMRRDVLTMGPLQILVSIAVALPYVFVSQAMLPREEDNGIRWRITYLGHSRVLARWSADSAYCQPFLQLRDGEFP